jgi:NADH dehydrogenase
MILVVGATGSLGGRIVRGLLERGEDVRVFVRRDSPSEQMAAQGLAHTAQSLIDAGAQPAWGDLKDRASIEAAVAGVDTVISTANAVKRWGEDTLETVDRQGTLDLIDAARAAGVSRFLYASVQGASSDSPVPLFQCKAACERALMESGLTYTIVQPSVFMEVWIGMMVGIPLMTQQTITLIGQGDHAHNFMSEQDVADYFIAMIDNPAAFNQAVMIGGPASHTWTEVVERVGGRMGAQLPLQYAPPGSTIAYLPEGANGLATAFEMYEDHLDIGEVSATYGVRPTTLDEYIDRTFVRS